MSKKIRPPVKIHGGKAYLARRIIALFPVHYERMTYVEPYGGAASVLLNKNPSVVEIYNDLNFELYNLFTVIKCNGGALTRELTLTPYSATEFKLARAKLTGGTPDVYTRRAALFYTVARQSRGGLGATWANSNRSRGGMAGDVNAWLTSIDENLPLVIERLREVAIENDDALKVIARYDTPNTLFYLDPPYYPDTRTHKTTYGVNEMSPDQHVALLKYLLNDLQGKFILSGYANSTYDQFAQTWSRTDIDMPNHSGQGSSKQRRTESLWRNY